MSRFYPFVFVLGVFCLGTSPTDAEAGLITSFYGSSSGPTASYDGTFVTGESLDGFYHGVFVDQSGVEFHRSFNLATGAASGRSNFSSLAGNQPVDGSDVGIAGVHRSGGRINYLGVSRNGTISSAPTYWTAPASPAAASSIPTHSGVLQAGTSDGRYVGSSQGAAVIGAPGQQLTRLPGDVIGAGYDISRDGRLVVGDGIWFDSGGGFVLLDPNAFLTTPVDALGLPTTFEGALYDPAQDDYLLRGNYLTTTFETKHGFWTLSGDFLGGFGSEFQFDTWDNDTFVANGDKYATAWLYDSIIGDSKFIRLSDFSEEYHSNAFGQKARVLDQFEGSNGLLLEGNSGTLSTYQPAAAVPEASSFVTMSIALGIGLVWHGFRRKRRPLPVAAPAVAVARTTKPAVSNSRDIGVVDVVVAAHVADGDPLMTAYHLGLFD